MARKTAMRKDPKRAERRAEKRAARREARGARGMVKNAQQMYNQFAQQSQQFDPRTFQAQYEPVYGAEVGRARENVMAEFNRRNQEEFGRQTQDVERQIVERGLDPTSEAADYLRRANTQRQDLARQEAMSAAEKAAYGVQETMYDQALKGALAPGQIWQQYQDPYLQYMQNQQRKWEIKNQPRGGGGGGGGAPQPGMFDRYMEQEFLSRYPQGGEQPRPDPYSEAGRAFLQGAAMGTGQRLTQG